MPIRLICELLKKKKKTYNMNFLQVLDYQYLMSLGMCCCDGFLIHNNFGQVIIDRGGGCGRGLIGVATDSGDVAVLRKLVRGLENPQGPSSSNAAASLRHETPPNPSPYRRRRSFFLPHRCRCPLSLLRCIIESIFELATDRTTKHRVSFNQSKPLIVQLTVLISPK